MSLEGKEIDYIAELFTANRATNWALGDASAELVRKYGRKVIGDIAEIGRCTKERVRQLIKVSMTFPEDKRYPDVDWSLYRAVLNASGPKRLNQDPLEVLEFVLERNMSLADIAKLGLEGKKRVKVSKTCEWCNSKVTVVADGGLGGERVYCPVCLVDNYSLDKRDDIIRYFIGVLE